MYLWEILKIHTCLHVVVGPGFVSTCKLHMDSYMATDIMRSSASYSVGPHGRVVLTPFSQQFARIGVTAPPLIGYVDCSHSEVIFCHVGYNYDVSINLVTGLHVHNNDNCPFTCT